MTRNTFHVGYFLNKWKWHNLAYHTTFIKTLFWEKFHTLSECINLWPKFRISQVWTNHFATYYNNLENKQFCWLTSYRRHYYASKVKIDKFFTEYIQGKSSSTLKENSCVNAYSIKDVKTLELEKSMTTLYGPTKKSFPNKGEREHLARIASFLMEKSKFCLYCLITEHTINSNSSVTIWNEMSSFQYSLYLTV